MITSLLQLILKNIPADYGWDDEGIVRIGGLKDIAAYVAGDFKGPCLIFCHGNGETAVSEKYWFKKLVGAGVSIVCPDYRGYGLTEGRLSEAGCYEVAHAAYSYLVDDRWVNPSDVYVLGYSLGSAIAVELASSEQVRGLILQAPFVSGDELLKVWAKTYAEQIPDCVLKVGLKATSAVFPTSSRLPKIAVPSLVFHGTSDEVIPYSQGEQVFKLLSSPQKRFVPVKNGGHNTFQYLMGDEYIRTLVEFMGGVMPDFKEQTQRNDESDDDVDYGYCTLFEERESGEDRSVDLKLGEINKLLKAGDIVGAESAIIELLKKEPGNAQVKMLYGTCLQLQGDQEGFVRIHEELAPRMTDVPDEKTLGMWRKYHRLWISLIAGGLVVAGAAGVVCVMLGNQIRANFNTMIRGQCIYAGPEYFELKAIERMPEGPEKDRRRKEIEAQFQKATSYHATTGGGIDDRGCDFSGEVTGSMED